MRKTKHNKHNDILFILISSFIVVVAWIGFNLYHIFITSTISEEVQVRLTPIDGTFDTATIQSLKARQQINPAFERQVTASQSAPTPSGEPSIAEPSVITPSIEAPETEPVSSPATDPSRFAPTETQINRLGQ